MKIKVPEIRERPVELNFEVAGEEIGLAPEDEHWALAAPVTGRLMVADIGGDIIASGSLTTRVSVHCSRCMAPLELPVECAKLQLRFRPQADQPAPVDGEVVVELDEDDISYYEKDTIDLRDELRAAILLELPDYPLCSGDCEIGRLPEGVELNRPAEAPPLPEWKRKLKSLELDPDSE